MQIDIKKEILNQFDKNNNQIILKLDTGYGKTIIALQILQ